MKEGDVLDRFQLEARAGEGAMGVVFRARDLARGGIVAVKVMQQTDAVEVARFQREAEVMVELQHPAVVRYVAHGRTPANEPFLAMEWLEGETLKARLARGPMLAIEVVDVGLALSSALAGAHGKGVVHRDVKPANVFLVSGSARSVKLLDFGIARVRRPNERGMALTEAGAMLGTPAYMSPEQARADADVGAQSDVFSLGATLFHAITGARPFEGRDVLEIVLRLTSERAPRVAERAPSTPHALAQLVDAMLAPNAAERPPMRHVFEVLQGLRAAAAPRQTSSHVVPIAPRATVVQETPAAPIARRSKARVALAFAGGLVVAAGVTVAAILAMGTTQTHKRGADARAKDARSSVELPVASPGLVPQKSIGCAQDYLDICVPLPFADLAAVDPDELTALAVKSMKRFDPSAYLAGISMINVVHGTLDLRPDTRSPTLFTFVGGSGREMLVTVGGGNLLLTKQSGATSNAVRFAPLPDDRCPISKAWALVAANFPNSATVTLLRVSGRAEYVIADLNGASRVNAVTCVLESDVRR
ncbi:MAG: serine/threonine-protein kinase [Polyangiaceae bacterium]